MRTSSLTFTVLTGDLERSVATIDGQDFVATHLSRIVIDDKTVLVISPVKFVADLQQCPGILRGSVARRRAHWRGGAPHPLESGRGVVGAPGISAKVCHVVRQASVVGCAHELADRCRSPQWATDSTTSWVKSG